MNNTSKFQRGVAVISIDTEQIWGHFDLMDEIDFQARYPDTRAVHDRLLALLCDAGVSATWTVVGLLASEGSRGKVDSRVTGLPSFWTQHIPPGTEATRPLWYARSFIRRLQRARIQQDIGIHGGLTHLIWAGTRVTKSMLARELRAGIAVLQEQGIYPESFVFPRDLEAHHAVLRDLGIRCYRGRAPICSERLRFNLAGSMVRAGEELLKLTPPVVFPREFLPGLWNLPASMFLYSLNQTRCRLIPARLRVERTKRGLEAAARCNGVFHLGLHPENLAESRFAFSTFESIIEEICRYRDAGDIEVLTMAGAIDRIASERNERALA